ncbi:hypothetical protein FKP32DRAFT_1642714 [Trametes sanguinea]|nr:hypothetical protein FKP32DRAFT_1642714 [Trametes sanguinea]
MEITGESPPRKRFKAEISGEASVLDRDAPTAASIKICAADEKNLKHLSRGPIESMPWDVLIEILQLSHPADLISLARTTKSLRAFLMSRKSIHLWKTARQRVSLSIPDCPSELSEPQYAVLLFTSECTLCGEPGIIKAAWELLARYCRSCAVRDLLTDTDIHEFMWYNIGYRRTFLLHAYHEYAERYSRVQYTEFQHSWQACTTHAEQQELVEGEIAKYQQRIRIVRTLEPWALPEEQERRTKLEQVRSKRFEDVLKRLREAGWGEELDKLTAMRMRRLREHEDVYKTVPLSEHAWAEIREAVNKHMESLRTCRLKEEWRPFVDSRLQWLQEIFMAHNLSVGGHGERTDLLAEFSDIALFPQLRTLLEAPMTDGITKETLEKTCEGALPALQKEWIREQEPYFLGLVKQEPRVSSLSDASMLSLAIVTFKCKKCRAVNMRWPYVLAHACGHSDPEYYVQYARDARENLTYRAILASFCAQRQLRLPHILAYDFEVQLATRASEEIIRACGFNPLRTSYAELRDCKVRIYCTICAVPSIGYAEAFDWENAAHHSMPRCDVHGFGWGPSQAAKSTKWAVLGQEDTALILALEAARRVAGTGLPDGLYRCAYCPHQTRKSIASHFSRAHQIDAPEIGKDFYIYPRPGDGTHCSLSVYPEYARTDRTAARDVKRGIAVFSSSLFQEKDE